MFKVLILLEDHNAWHTLPQDLTDASFSVLSCINDPQQLANLTIELKPDLIIAASVIPSEALFNAAKLIGQSTPCPFVLFTTDNDIAKIHQATASNIHAYVIDGYAKHRLSSLIQVAHARFRHEQVLKEELADLTQRFEERKLVDRAKGLIMRTFSYNEEQAFEMLRSLAMKSRMRIGLAAKNIIDISRATEAVNRAGQLRMLSQRVVRCYAQILVNMQTTEATNVLTDTIVRIDSNIGILEKAVATQDYGDLVNQVHVTWKNMLSYAYEKPELAHLDILNQLAEEMLKQSEHLTNFLEDTGLVSTLHILNVSGKQRMYCQRIVKLCLILSISPSAADLRELQKLCERFDLALIYLNNAPLSTTAITNNLVKAKLEWKKLTVALAQKSHAEVLQSIVNASEQLLNTFEQLTNQYEQAMQMLIGDRVAVTQ